MVHGVRRVWSVGRVDHIQATYGFKAGYDLAVKGLHAGPVTFITSKVEVHVLSSKPVRIAGKPEERVLDSVTEKLTSKKTVIERHTH